ncbi:MAG TPA: DinB family protein [Vicinamibacteria bacterium]|nr:DinB family protein [Vicinamibacteria bacterium]
MTNPRPNPALAPYLALLDEAFERSAWHGPNLRGSVRGLSAKRAAWRPGPSRHSIWEIVVHAAYWKYAVRRRLTGQKRGSFAYPGSNWFTRPSTPDEAAWRRDVARLQEEHRQLREVVARVSRTDLAGEGSARMIRGVAAHDLYHAGQIQLLKRLGPR